MSFNLQIFTVRRRSASRVVAAHIGSLGGRKREAGKVPASQALVVLFAVYSGLYASRNIPVSSLLLILVIGPWLSSERLASTCGDPIRATETRLCIVRRSLRLHFLQRMQAIDR
jgi:hypothetical protein